jgi:DNA-binding helix-hairpin-helix protein with protein kinase domain
MSLRLPNGRVVKLGSQIGAGAEGVIVRVDGTADLCAKIYYKHAVDIEDRLAALIRHPARELAGDHREHLHVAWPVERLLDDAGGTVGFLMPSVTGTRLSGLFEPGVRVDAVQQPTWRVMLTVASRTARLLDMLHNLGVVVGDVSPTNLMVTGSGHVTLIDCDAVQFTDPGGDRRFSVPKLSPDYSPPEIGPDDVWRTPHHDLFGLAILVCQLLMEGEHPFVGIPTGTDPEASVRDNIRWQNNRITHPERLAASPDDLPVGMLPPRIRELASRCFGPGHADPSCRPSANEWATELDRAGFELMGCQLNPRHLYHDTLSSCVWCDLLRAGHGERYPALDAAHVADAARAAQTAGPVGAAARAAGAGSRPGSTGRASAGQRPSGQARPGPTPGPSTPPAGREGQRVAWIVAGVCLTLLLIAIIVAAVR